VRHSSEATQKELQRFVVDTLDGMKIESIEVIDVEKKTTLTRAIIIGIGRSVKHLDSCIEKLRMELKALDIFPPKTEGKATDWLLLDLGDILINLFTKETRKKYDIESLWKKER
jgi:ribosome-associated protein